MRGKESGIGGAVCQGMASNYSGNKTCHYSSLLHSTPQDHNSGRWVGRPQPVQVSVRALQDCWGLCTFIPLFPGYFWLLSPLIILLILQDQELGSSPRTPTAEALPFPRNPEELRAWNISFIWLLTFMYGSSSYLAGIHKKSFWKPPWNKVLKNYLLNQP